MDLAKLDPKTEQIIVYVPPPPLAAPQGSLDYDGNGFIWITTAGGALRFDPAAVEITEFQSKHLQVAAWSGDGLRDRRDHDGNGWCSI